MGFLLQPNGKNYSPPVPSCRSIITIDTDNQKENGERHRISGSRDRTYRTGRMGRTYIVFSA